MRNPGLSSLILFLLAPAVARPQPAPDGGLDGLVWRQLGPFRGGRVVAVSGVAQQPAVFYMGTTGGGVWKSDDAGTSWRNISDGFFQTGSVGAVAVSQSHPDVVYVGMGESPVRINMSSYGDGVYRSDDGGKSWRHLGLERTRQIGAVAIHPNNPEVAYVAAQGNHWAPSDDRGVYGTTDGGRTWTRLLAGDNATTGAVDLKLDPADPTVIYAAMWDHLRHPWQLRSGGPGSGIFKSTDAGRTWARLTTGLPARMGKIGIAVAPTDSRRLYAAVETERAQHGLYRSDDAGETWRLVNRSRHVSTRPWYYMHVIVDPTDREVVYVPSQSFWKSTDGGVTFERRRTDHGDGHALWINPADPRTMILGDDGGAAVTRNGGDTWSTLLNQPTAQIYRVSTDNRFPYTVYGAQQDNTTVGIKSRSDFGGIGADDYYSVGGGEAGFVVPDPFEPDIVYAGSEIGLLERFDHRTRRATTILAYPIFPEGRNPREVAHRFEVNAPIAVSRHTPGTIYHGAQHVLRSTDRGQSWRVISPDLTRNIPEQQGAGGVPFSNERIDAHNALSYLAESPLDAKVLWAGSDDGLVHLTRDGGTTWANVTPFDRGDALVSAIDPSPHAPGTAWVAVNRSRSGELTPLAYRTDDFGTSWRPITAGLPEAPVRVIREDPVVPGLLFAGTEVGVRVSFDGGVRWRSLQTNLPVTPVTDLVVKGNDLVISTQGRGFWVLDDVSPLRAWGGDGPRLFPISTALAVQGTGSISRTTEASNPPAALIYYRLDSLTAKAPVEIEVRDSAGTTVLYSARLAKADRPGNDILVHGARPMATPADAGPGGEARPGLNRLEWDLSTRPPTRIDGVFDNEAPGYRVRPGRYRARLITSRGVFDETFEVRPDPRLGPLPEEAVDQKYQLLRQLTAVFDTMARTVNRFHALRAALDSAVRHGGRAGRSAASLGHAIGQWEAGAVAREIEDGNDRVDFDGRLAFDLIVAIAWLDGSDPPVTSGFVDVTRDLAARWAALETVARDLGARAAALLPPRRD
ncbi:MAG: WD40/YVTN/BNR-like repeat-containing protein [Gemmatimonadales bacterium]